VALANVLVEIPGPHPVRQRPVVVLQILLIKKIHASILGMIAIGIQPFFNDLTLFFPTLLGRLDTVEKGTSPPKIRFPTR